MTILLLRLPDLTNNLRLEGFSLAHSFEATVPRSWGVRAVLWQPSGRQTFTRQLQSGSREMGARVLLSAFAFSFGLKRGSPVQGGSSILWKCLQRNAPRGIFQVIPNPVKLTGILTPRLWTLSLGSKGIKTYESIKPYTQMSIAAVFRLTKIWNPLRFLPTEALIAQCGVAIQWDVIESWKEQSVNI